MANTVEMPKLGFDMAEGKLIRWVKAENEKIEKGDVLAEIETDKATVEVESPYGGIIAKHLAAENTILPVSSPIAIIIAEGEDFNPDDIPTSKSQPESEIQDKEKVPKSQPESSKKPEAESAAEEPQSDDFIKASPIAKRIAEDKALDLSNVTGSGPSGRIVKRDVEKALTEDQASDSKPKTKGEASVVSGTDESVEISRLRAAIGKRMLQSHQSIPYFTLTHRYDAAALISLRKEMNADEPDDSRISVNDFFIRAAALALKQFPNLNASLNGSQLIRHGNINIGVAVAVENGLLTIVVKNADQKSLAKISEEMKAMTASVRDGKVSNKDIEGSTFTISNLGMFAVEDFTAIINPPEAAILAISSAAQAPVVIDGSLAIGWRVNATLSADHRITDGAEAARFMQHLGLYLEQPWRLL